MINLKGASVSDIYNNMVSEILERLDNFNKNGSYCDFID